MEYLVLGGNGFIGSFIVDEIISNGHNVTVLDMGPEKFRVPLSNVKYIYGSINNLELLNETFEGKDILIHSVSTTVPYTSNQNIPFDIESNLISSVNIFRIAVEKGIKRIVYLSSGGAVYGEPITVPIPEDHPTNPLSSYGITKLAIEKYLNYFSVNSGIEYNIIRPSNPYGPRQNPFSNQGVIAVFLGKVLRDEVIEVWGDGTIAKDYVYIKDIASAIYKSSISDKTSEAFNIGSGSFISLNEIIEMIKKVTSKDVKVSYVNSNKFDVSKVCLDINNAKKFLDFQPKVDLEQGVKETWDFIKQLNT
ncbi:NAD-dependent epimerase/dehydratase family protein [Empedobacter sp.]|uniref:NAD-dependent epimerase/dehydratase family protein n=1 Tax=Empedobacter sp. TaxID=1927715 RepID=UPI002897D150|nr:NAD-dependent epimerase/dehydratase family protein [Empedobacter sp.]